MNDFTLGPLKLESDLLLAPMMDVSTPSYVKLIQEYGGIGIYVMPMIFVNQIAQAPKTIRPIAEFAEKNRPSGIQIVGSGKSVETIVKAVDILNSYDFDFLDINSGCPAKHTCHSGGGASLLQPHRFNDLQNLIKTTISTSNKTVSVKIRTGWETTDGLQELVKMIEDEGAAFLTVHGRTAKQNYSGIVDLESIRKVKSWANIPVVGNGDVYDYKSYLAMKEFTDVDAIMIGRASMGNPKIFSDIVNKIESPSASEIEVTDENGLPPEFTHEFKSKLQKINTAEEIREYIDKILEIIEGLGKYWNNEKYKAVELKRNIIWMLRGTHNGSKMRENIGKARNLEEILEYVNGDEFLK